MPLRRLSRSVWVPRPPEEVFPFFSRPENLALLTPPDLAFEVLTPSPVAMREGALVDLRIRRFGLPLGWRTLIETYDPPRSFSDTQVSGPYSFWHHTHRFVPERGGTRLEDEVLYALPFDALVHGLFVRPDLDRIFAYRAAVIARLFAGPRLTGPAGDPMTLVIAGASGFIGRPLVDAALASGARVRVLSRSAASGPARPGLETVRWDPADASGAWRAAVDGADAVVNLCGESVAGGRWTAARKKAILESRVTATRALVGAIGSAAKKPAALVNASAVGCYGARGEEVLTEASAPGTGFLAEVCAAWEAEARKAEASGTRVALARLGVVLGPGGGALSRMAIPFKLFAGGPVGDGSQWMPWVHLDDAVGALLHLARTPAAKGPFNVVSPEPSRNIDVSRALGRALGRPCWAPAPAFAFKLALGEMSGLLLDSQRVEPAALKASGYRFARPSADDALKASV